MTSTVLAAPQTVRPPARDEESGRWTAAFQVAITADEPVFAGHYPDFPIFPGVCVLECVRRAAESVTPDEAGEVRMAAVESARFLSSVHPGDEMTIDLTWAPRGEHWRCTAQVATERGRAATVRLRYEQSEAPC